MISSKMLSHNCFRNIFVPELNDVTLALRIVHCVVFCALSFKTTAEFSLFDCDGSPIASVFDWLGQVIMGVG